MVVRVPRGKNGKLHFMFVSVKVFLNKYKGLGCQGSKFRAANVTGK
jgi:hypothetical protein